MNVHPNTNDAYRLMHNGILALARAERQGLCIDVEYVVKTKAQLTRRIDRLEARFYDTDFYRRWAHTSRSVNINSNTQLAHFLYNVKKLQPAYFTDSGQGATSEDALKALHIPELDQLIELRKLRKLRDTYLDGFVREATGGVIHPFFNLHLVRTFRSSSNNPNFQNIPKRDVEAMQTVRKAIYPRKDHQFVEVDYSSLEVRIAACYHKDDNMLPYINHADLHTDMAKQIFKLPDFDRSKHGTLRQAVKNGFVFPQFYGDYFKHCADIMATEWCKLPVGKWSDTDGITIGDTTIGAHMKAVGIGSYDAFVNYIRDIEHDFWYKRFAKYAAWKERWWRQYQKRGYIDMYTGFRCTGVMIRNDCINYPIQGSAFHCLLWSFIELDHIMQTEQWRTRLVGQIHDSILLDVHPDELEYVTQVVRHVTCTALTEAWPWIIVPLDVEIAINKVNGSWDDID